MSEETQNAILSPATLPQSGRVVSNRMVKVALYEHLAPIWGGPPSEAHFNLYSAWAKEKWGMTFTGNVQVSPSHLGLGRDIIIPPNASEENVKPFQHLAHVMRGTDGNSLAIVQLSHSGRQSSNFLGGRLISPPLAPSAIKVPNKGSSMLEAIFHNLIFRTPKSMTHDNIDNVVDEFVAGAILCEKAGFDGVELHNAHGYLLTQFTSLESNTRTDEYSAQGDNALRLLNRIVTSVRQATSPRFVVGVKFNAGDFVASSSPTDKEQHARALSQVRTISGWRIFDFIEISGGDYSRPDFMSDWRPTRRQSFFADISKAVMESLSSDFSSDPTAKPLILLTGGLRTPAQLLETLQSSHSDLVGLGRAALLAPNAPSQVERLSSSNSPEEWDTPFGPEPNLMSSQTSHLPLIGASLRVSWYNIVMRMMSAWEGAHKSQVPIEKTEETFTADYSISAPSAGIWLWLWLHPTDIDRMKRFVLRLGLVGFVVLLAIFLWWHNSSFNLIVWQRSVVANAYRNMDPN